MVEGKFDEPVGLAQDAGGDWYVTDTWNHRVQKFDAGWHYLAQWAVNGWGSESVVNKPYVAVDGARGLVYITDPEGYRVLVFGMDGSFKGTWGHVRPGGERLHPADRDRGRARRPGLRRRRRRQSHHDLPSFRELAHAGYRNDDCSGA